MNDSQVSLNRVTYKTKYIFHFMNDVQCLSLNKFKFGNANICVKGFQRVSEV